MRQTLPCDCAKQENGAVSAPAPSATRILRRLFMTPPDLPLIMRVCVDSCGLACMLSWQTSRPRTQTLFALTQRAGTLRPIDHYPIHYLPISKDKIAPSSPPFQPRGKGLSSLLRRERYRGARSGIRGPWPAPFERQWLASQCAWLPIRQCPIIIASTT